MFVEKSYIYMKLRLVLSIIHYTLLIINCFVSLLL